MGIVDDPEKVDHIDDFLPPIKVLFPIRDIGDVVAAKGIEIDLGLGQLSENQGNMARLERACVPVAIHDRRPWKKLFLQPTCQRFRLFPGCSLNIKLFVALSRGHKAKLHTRD
ncbi:MAG: hypothetical protein JW395_3635 [Nitrospira sp.]|nr:hypothetical protein [Nitrospira sp.]